MLAFLDTFLENVLLFLQEDTRGKDGLNKRIPGSRWPICRFLLGILLGLSGPHKTELTMEPITLCGIISCTLICEDRFCHKTGPAAKRGFVP